ncbi:MAG: hypothetical protein F6J87_27745 [Spirulina sp. SIO3F2]|nr:hypothetical protein [Spirulina sp. SIO3F2]
MKNNQRLDHELLAETLRARAMVDPKTIEQTLAACNSSGALFTEQLVRDGVVSDWELAQVCCETFGLPFLPADLYDPDLDLIELFEPQTLRQTALVPLDRFGDVLVVAMPCMVPSDILDDIADRLSVTVMPVVGSVRANVRFLDEHLPDLAGDLARVAEEADGGDWTNVLDMGDAAVQVDIVGAEAEAALDQVDAGEPLEQVVDVTPEPESPPLDLLDLDAARPAMPSNESPAVDENALDPGRIDEDLRLRFEDPE